MSHAKSAKMIAACIIAALGSSSGYSQSQSAEVAVPTIVVSVQQMAAPTANSSATFALYNGGNAVALLNPQGDIAVYKATDIRFIFAPDIGKQYMPIGITFRQTAGDSSGGTSSSPSDQSGTRNFPARSVADAVLTVHANSIDSSRFKYSILFERLSDGAVGIIDPEVINVPDPHPTP